MTKKTRIFIDGDVLINPHFSGIGHYTLELLRALDSKLSNEKYITASLLIHYRHIDKVKKLGFKNIKLTPSPFSLRVANGLKIRNKQPPLDLFFGKGVYIFPNFTSWPLLFSKSLPVIYDLSYERYPQFAEPRNQEFLSSQVYKSIKRASRILTISQNSKLEIVDFYNYSVDLIDVIYPAVDKNKFNLRPKSEVDKVKSKYGIVGDYILFVGNIEPRKNLKNLLLAYEKLPQHIRNKYSLLLVGAKGWQEGEIFSTINRLRDNGNQIQLPSKYINDGDIPAIYSGASLFVYPSLYEGFGIPPLEAMACGVPTIVSDNSSLPEAVGSAAKLVNALSVKNISDSIQSVLGDSEASKRLRREGFTQVQKFSWEDAAVQLLQSIKKLG